MEEEGDGWVVEFDPGFETAEGLVLWGVLCATSCRSMGPMRLRMLKVGWWSSSSSITVSGWQYR